MSNVAVRARNLTKSYTLYPTPWSRMREVIGLKRPRTARYVEHVAVDSIDLDIQFGEKVGFIGRNGAGKSTLLKLITGVIEPTDGSLEISGETHALLQMSAGFHTDFTGRENARAYLANLGVAVPEADRLIDDIIEFAELEEYIDQPLKTYSTGMQMRLTFAASTTIAPKLFVIDEVLGVGDAYFQQKSFSRIKELCEKNRTTLLLVSHDIYTAAKVCDRMIWIDRGRIKFDGDPKTALNLYEASIKEQEEQRLRKKAVLVSASAMRGSHRDHNVVLIELRPPDGQFASDIEIESAQILGPDETVLADIKAGESPARNMKMAPDASVTTFRTVDDGSSWNYQTLKGGEMRISLNDHGSVFHKGVLKVQGPLESNGLRASMVMKADAAQPLIVLIYDADHHAYIAGRFELEANVPCAIEFPLATAGMPGYAPNPTDAMNTRHGSGGIRITSIDILDRSGKSTRQLRQGGAYTIEFEYKLSDPNLSNLCEFNVAVSRDGVLDCMRAFNPHLSLPVGRPSGVIRFEIASLPLANGTYVLSALVARRGYYAENVAVSYTVADDVFDVVARAVEFVVSERHPAYKGTIFKAPGEWHISE